MPVHHFTLALVIICFASAGNAADSAEDCSSIVDRDTRLSCFDTFFPPTETASSPIEARQLLESESQINWFSITPHKPNYVLPATYNFSSDFSPYTDLGPYFNDAEIKFQLSLKTRIWHNLWRNSSLWVAYTQMSLWQLYADEEASAPFRETNHEPELMWQIPVDFSLFGMDARLTSFSLNHQSNGQSDPLSRSWNRLTGTLFLEKDRFVVSAKTWVRIDDPSNDNNPNIEDYMGRVQLGVAYKGDTHTFSTVLKNNLSSANRSGVELSWAFPLTEHLKGFAQVYSGYGESMIDMENYTNRIGIGIALTDWL